MAKHVSETPATQWLKEKKVSYTEHPYDYVDHGGTAESSKQLGLPEHEVVKTLAGNYRSFSAEAICASKI